MDLLPVELNPRGALTSAWKISNEFRPISGIRYSMIMRAALQEYGRE